MGAAKRIVHPTDFSTASEPAFADALERAQREGAELILVHVLDAIVGLSDEMYLAKRLELREVSEVRARRDFERLLARAKTAGVPASDVLADGWAPEAITRIAKARGADLIVMGTHGRTGIQKLLLGSVAERVIGMAPCPVLTVRAS